MTKAALRGQDDGDAAWRGRLVLLPGALLFIGRGGPAAAHAHHAVQVVWAVEGSLRVELATGAVVTDAAIIPALATHAFDASGASVVMLLVERHAAAGVALSRRAAAESVDAAGELSALGAPDVAAPLDALAAWARRALDRLGGPTAGPPLTLAIRKIVTAIDSGAISDLAAGADLAGLSPTRLTHRFTAEVGLPFRRYVLWSRIKRAVVAVQGGADLTRASLDAGFSDSAHFSRTFRETIGLAPSRVLPFLEIVGNAWAPPTPSR